MFVFKQKMIIMKPFCLFVLLLASFFLNDIKAQSIVTVEATLDSTEMYIGRNTERVGS